MGWQNYMRLQIAAKKRWVTAREAAETVGMDTASLDRVRNAMNRMRDAGILRVRNREKQTWARATSCASMTGCSGTTCTPAWRRAEPC